MKAVSLPNKGFVGNPLAGDGNPMAGEGKYMAGEGKYILDAKFSLRYSPPFSS